MRIPLGVLGVWIAFATVGAALMATVAFWPGLILLVLALFALLVRISPRLRALRLFNFLALYTDEGIRWDELGGSPMWYSVEPDLDFRIQGLELRVVFDKKPRGVEALLHPVHPSRLQGHGREVPEATMERFAQLALQERNLARVPLGKRRCLIRVRQRFEWPLEVAIAVDGAKVLDIARLR